LGALKAGDGVDLERSATASTRISGHFVQGHVDCPAAVVSKSKDGQDALTIRVQLPEAYAELMRFIVSKGYVAIDGASLTVVDVDSSKRTFSFMLIPHTQSAVVIPRREIGELVNIEVDCLGKYAAAAVDARSHSAPSSSSSGDAATDGHTLAVAYGALGVSLAALGLAAYSAWKTRNA
jgi:riboflavin synthase